MPTNDVGDKDLITKGNMRYVSDEELENMNDDEFVAYLDENQDDEDEKMLNPAIQKRIETMIRREQEKVLEVIHERVKSMSKEPASGESSDESDFDDEEFDDDEPDEGASQGESGEEDGESGEDEE